MKRPCGWFIGDQSVEINRTSPKPSGEVDSYHLRSQQNPALLDVSSFWESTQGAELQSRLCFSEQLMMSVQFLLDFSVFLSSCFTPACLPAFLPSFLSLFLPSFFFLPSSLPSFLLFLVFWFFWARVSLYYVALAVLELITQTRLAWNSEYCLYLCSDGIKGVTTTPSRDLFLFFISLPFLFSFLFFKIYLLLYVLVVCMSV